MSNDNNHIPLNHNSGMVQLAERDQRPQCYAWAPGTYGCKCSECDKEFLGDKRASMCAPCSYGDNVKRCYQCDKEVNYLFDDSRCGECTRLTVDEVTGGDT